MLGFTLLPFKDELIYGLLARYRWALGSPSSKMVCQLLLNQPTCGSSLLTPSFLDTLAERMLYSGLSVEELISRHTAYPYFETFTVSKKRREAADYMRTRRPQLGSIGLGFSNVGIHRSLNYCRACRDNQIKLYGSSSWLRMHQVPGVFLCDEHDEQLLASSFSPTGVYGLMCPEASTKDIVVDHGLSYKNLMLIAKHSRYFMENPSVKSRKDLMLGARAALYNAGWIRSSTGTIRPGLTKEFSAMFGERTLAVLGCSVNKGKQQTWLHQMAGSTVIGQHPLRYILLLIFLNNKPEELFSMPAAPERSFKEFDQPSQERLDYLRESIVLQAAAGATRHKIMTTSGTRWSTMRQHDREWLEQHVPSKRPRVTPLIRSMREYDDRTYPVIMAAIDRLQNSDLIPKRINVASILKEARLPILRARLHRLPQCTSLIHSACETVDQLWMRRFKWALHEADKSGVAITWKDLKKVTRFRTNIHPHLHAEALRQFRSFHFSY